VFLAIAVDNLADAQSLSETDNDIDELAVQAPLLTEQVRRLMGSKVKSLARHYNYFAVPPVRAQSIVFVCLSIRQHISNFWRMLVVVVTRSSYGGVAIRHVLPVL